MLSIKFTITELKTKGSILLESLLAIIILSTSITVVIQAMTAGVRAGRDGTLYTQVIWLMDNKMAELREQKFIAPGLKEEGHFPEPWERFNYILTTQPLSTDDQNKINLVQLTVFWQSGIKKYSLETETYLFNPQ